MNKNFFLLFFLVSFLLSFYSFALASEFAVEVLEYSPGDDVTGFDDPSLALGPLAPGGGPSNASVVSLGGFGGYIILGFDHHIENDPLNPGGWDFIVFGNAFYIDGDENIHCQEPGYVEVAVDSNVNGLADDTFYLIPGIPNPGTPASFPISDDYWGQWGVDHRDYPTEGYADVTPTLGESYGSALVPDDPRAVGITPGSRGGDAFDIANAIDASGNLANLSRIDFVKITTAIDISWPWNIAVSTEVDAVADVAAIPEPATGLMLLTGFPLLIKYFSITRKKKREVALSKNCFF